MSEAQSKVPIAAFTCERGVMDGGSANCKSVGVTHPQPDIAYPITPRQYYDLFRRTERLDGETRLLFAVLEDAIRCYTVAARSSRRSDRTALQEVKEWVSIRGDRDLFSFDSICRALDLDPQCLRRRLESLEASMLPMRQYRSVGRRIVIRPRPERGHSSFLEMSGQLIGLKPPVIARTDIERTARNAP